MRPPGILPKRGLNNGATAWLAAMRLLGSYYLPGAEDAPGIFLVLREADLTATSHPNGSLAIVLIPTAINRTLWIKDAFDGTWRNV